MYDVIIVAIRGESRCYNKVLNEPNPAQPIRLGLLIFAIK